MKKIVKVMAILTSLVFFLGACGKKEEAKRAVEAFVNAEFYLKDFENYKKSFGKQLEETEEGLVTNSLVEGMTGSGLDKEETKSAAEAIFKTLTAKTSYQVVIIEETEDHAKVELTIKGLDAEKYEKNLHRLSVEKVIELVTAAGIENVASEEDLQALTSKADLEKAKEVVDQFHEDSKQINQLMIKGISEMETASQGKKISLTLETNKEKKKYWQVKDEQAVLDQITEILINPY